MNAELYIVKFVLSYLINFFLKINLIISSTFSQEVLSRNKQNGKYIIHSNKEKQYILIWKTELHICWLVLPIWCFQPFNLILQLQVLLREMY